jgi:hypothetical protein
MNSTVWNSFKFRPNDIVVATYGKSGTTWVQQILGQLIFNGVEGIDVSHLSPWVDLRVVPPEVIAGLEHLTHRRFVKTHLPVDALVFSRQAKYLYIGRDGRDAIWSMYNHHANATQQWYDALNNTPSRVGDPIEKPAASIHEYYREWLARELSVLAVLGKHPFLVGDPGSAECQAHSLQPDEGRSARLDTRDRSVPGHPDRRNKVWGYRPALHLRLHEGPR